MPSLLDADNYSKARKYVDSCSVNELPPPLARFVTSPTVNVQVIVDFTIIAEVLMERYSINPARCQTIMDNLNYIIPFVIEIVA